MGYDEKLLGIDYLVFSSHKSGSQTVKGTLQRSGFVCEHCHGLGNIEIDTGSFSDFLYDYANRHGRQLRAVSVFREPMQRHVSSFFQWYGSRPLMRGEVEDEGETIIARQSIDELRDLFLAELKDESLIGYEDSLNEISTELGCSPADLLARKDGSCWVYESPLIHLYIYRFDQLFDNPAQHLSTLVGKEIRVHVSNVAQGKWYSEIYRRFKSGLIVPREVVCKTYGRRRDIIDGLYEEGFEELLAKTCQAYCATD